MMHDGGNLRRLRRSGPVDRNALELVKQLSASYFVPRALHVAAELGVADHLGDAPTRLAELARATGADEDALGRILRLLAAQGVFALERRAVRHTPASELLRSDHPASLRDFVRMFGLPVFWRPAEELIHAVRTGEAAAPRAFPGRGFWGYLEDHPDAARLFDAAMAAKSRAPIGAILRSHDFSRYRTVADIGGGQGHLLRAVLEAHPGLTGVLFDLPHVIEAARTLPGSTERLAFQAGDFFRDELPACDAYLMMTVLHDWPDGEARRILTALRRAAPPHARLLVVETRIGAEAAGLWPVLLDVVMLALFAGRERSAEEYRALLHEGGFELVGVTETEAGFSIFEAVPA
jgi:hypothetical protein